MCGIVGAIAERDVVPILLEGLRRLEYRGYDSAGIAVLDADVQIERVRSLGKVADLEQSMLGAPLKGVVGIAHTRWATHGKPSEKNAHPHVCRNSVALVHNGIIENHEDLRAKQTDLGFEFTSETDTEVVVHAVYQHIQRGKNLLTAVKDSLNELQGAYAIAVVSQNQPEKMIVARKGSPLVIGVGIGEHFIASDVAALLPVTNRFIFLEDGDVAEIMREEVVIYDASDQPVIREVKHSKLSADAVEKGPYKHFMLKEIFEQPKAIADTLEGRITNGSAIDESFGINASSIFEQIEGVHIIACGTSYHAGLIAQYWMESIAKIPCNVEIASEFRYRKPIVRKNNLIVTISQSGETADTLAALEEAKKLGFGHSLAVCNVAESSLVRASDLCLLTRAGVEVGVASTKAFTTQLVALMLLVLAVGKKNGLDEAAEKRIVSELEKLPRKVEQALEESHDVVKALSEEFTEKDHALFLGRGPMYPVAMEGALKLKEISYIHAEAYPAGELKHGPLALVDADMPIITVAPNDDLLEKLKSNIQEVAARGGQLYVFADPKSQIKEEHNVKIIHLISIDEILAPILYTIPLQLLSYYVAILKGTDVDQPRNLAKSVTVE